MDQWRGPNRCAAGAGHARGGAKLRAFGQRQRGGTGPLAEPRLRLHHPPLRWWLCCAARLVLVAPDEWARGAVRVKELASREERDVPLEEL